MNVKRRLSQITIVACLCAINIAIFHNKCWAETKNTKCSSITFVAGNEYKDQATLDRMHQAYIDKQKTLIKNKKRLSLLIKESPKEGMYIGIPNEILNKRFILFTPNTNYCGTAGCTVYFFSIADNNIIEFCDPVQVSGPVCIKRKPHSNMPEFVLNGGVSVKYNGINYCRSPIHQAKP